MENPFTEEKKEAMQECINSTIQEFGLSYGKAFAAALVDHLKEGGSKRRSSMSMPEGLMLKDAPPPSEVIYQGWAEKKGAFRKNWKKRWVVCYNKDKNFVVSYYAAAPKDNDVKNLKKSKGDICLDGYSLTDELTEAEKKDCGENCLKLSCGPASKRRVWYIRGESKEAIDKFRDPLKNACKKAKPEFKAGDPVEGAAFEAAYRQVRSSKGLGYSAAGGSEGECLGGLVAEVVTKEVMGEVFDAFPDNMQGRGMKSGAEKAMDTAIGGAVGAAWGVAKSAAAQGRPALESGIKGALGPIQEAEQMLFGKITEAVAGVTDPVVEKLKGATISPLVEKVLAPVSAAYQTAVKVWAKIAKDMVAAVKKDASSLESATWDANRAYWWDSEIDGAAKALLDALATAAAVLGDFPAYDLMVQLKDGMHHLMARGIATLNMNIKTGSTPDEAYELVLGQVCNDSKLMFGDMVKALITAVVMPPFDEAVKGPAADLVAPIEEMIPEPVKAFLSLVALVEACLDQLVGGVIDSIVGEPTSPEQDKIAALEAELK